jgi:hypothetical protein
MAKKVWTPEARKAFAAKMKAAREAKNPSGRKRIHTQKFDRTVKAVKKSLRKYHRKGNAYAIASARLGEKRSVLKRHRRRNARISGWIVRVDHAGKHYYLTPDKILTTGKSAARTFTMLKAKHAAKKLLRVVPPGSKVYVEGSG